MKGKVKYIVIGLIVLLVGLYFYLMNMETIRGSLIVINIQKNEPLSHFIEYGESEYNLTKDQLDKLINKPNDYIKIEFGFCLRNLSSWKKIYYIELRPIFPGKIKDMVFAYRRNRWDGLESPIFLETKDFTVGHKQIIIKKQVFDEDFLKLLGQVKFEVWGKVGTDPRLSPFIRFGSCSAMLDTSHDTPIKNQIKREEVKRNPSFKKVKASFFDTHNSEDFFLFPVYIRDGNKFSIADYNYQLHGYFKFNKDFEFTNLSHKNIPPVNMDEKWIPNPHPKILLIKNNHISESSIQYWHRKGYNICTITYPFPWIALDDTRPYEKTPKIKHFESTLRDDKVAIAAGIYSPHLDYFKKKKIQFKPEEYILTTVTGEKIKGVSIDLDNDKSVDIFWYYQLFGQNAEFLRIYINIEGTWECCWEELIEACL